MDGYILRSLTFSNFLRKVNKLLQLVSNKFKKSLVFKVIGEYNTPLNGRVIVATKNGLYLLVDGNIVLISEGEFYGITKYEGLVYVFEKLKNKGRVISFSISIIDKDFDVLIEALSPGCHQIDFLGNELFVTDTYNNRILIYDSKGVMLDEFYPIGKLENGRKSKNYGHINSIYSNDGIIYLLCHNETKKTGRKSEVLKVKRENFQLIDRKTVEASSANSYL